MTSIDQKRRERSVLDFYLRIIGVEGNVDYQERPDFIVTTNSQRIGIEITEYHQPTHSGHKFKRTLVEAEWKKIRSAVVNYRDTHTGLENLSVMLRFIDLAVPRQNQHYEFIRAVHDEINHVKPNLSRRFTTIRVDDQHSSVIRQYLRESMSGWSIRTWNGTGTTHSPGLALRTTNSLVSWTASSG